MCRRIAELSITRLSLRVLILLLLIILPPVFSAHNLKADTPNEETLKRVLVLSSNDFSLPGSSTMSQAISSTLRKEYPTRVQFYYENLDSNRIQNDNKQEEMFIGLLRQKYQKNKIDLIFAFGEPALRALSEHRADLLPGTPIVFCYFDETEEQARTLVPDVAGVSIKMDYGRTVELALDLQPETE